MKKQNGECVVYGAHFELSEMEADHIDPWHGGGENNRGKLSDVVQKS